MTLKRSPAGDFLRGVKVNQGRDFAQNCEVVGRGADGFDLRGDACLLGLSTQYATVLPITARCRLIGRRMFNKRIGI